MNARGLFETILLLRMNVYYLYETLDENECMMHETLDENEYMMHEILDENRFFEIFMDVWSRSNEWNLYFLRRNIWICEWMDAIPSLIIFLWNYFIFFVFFPKSWGCIDE